MICVYQNLLWGLETHKRVLWQTVKTQMKCRIRRHFIRGMHYLLRQKGNLIFFENYNLLPLNTMAHTDLTVLWTIPLVLKWFNVPENWWDWLEYAFATRICDNYQIFMNWFIYCFRFIQRRVRSIVERWLLHPVLGWTTSWDLLVYTSRSMLPRSRSPTLRRLTWKIMSKRGYRIYHCNRLPISRILITCNICFVRSKL